jgi:hypothetical protein
MRTFKVETDTKSSRYSWAYNDVTEGALRFANICRPVHKSHCAATGPCRSGRTDTGLQTRVWKTERERTSHTSLSRYSEGLADRGVAVRFPAGARDFPLFHSVQIGSGAHPASIQRVLAAVSLGVKLPGREADHSSPSSAEINNDGAIRPLIHGVVLNYIIKYRNNFTFTFFTIPGRQPATPLYPRYPFDRRLDELQSRSGRCGQEKNPCRESNPGRTAPTPSLYRLSYPDSFENKIQVVEKKEMCQISIIKIWKCVKNWQWNHGSVGFDVNTSYN